VGISFDKTVAKFLPKLDPAGDLRISVAQFKLRFKTQIYSGQRMDTSQRMDFGGDVAASQASVDENAQGFKKPQRRTKSFTFLDVG
jgi:hypothetical protein